MEFGPRETKVSTGRLDDGSIRVTLEHTRLKITAEGTAKSYDEAKQLATDRLSEKVQERVSA